MPRQLCKYLQNNGLLKDSGSEGLKKRRKLKFQRGDRQSSEIYRGLQTPAADPELLWRSLKFRLFRLVTVSKQRAIAMSLTQAASE